MKVTLLGLEFNNSNMGCQALSYSFTNLFSEAAKLFNIEVRFYAIVFENNNEVIHVNTNASIEEYVIKYKSFHFWKHVRKLFKECDLIVDFTGGDSFSDIYGSKRFFLGSILKICAINSKTPFMLGPQTYGPFIHSYNKIIAKWIIKHSRWVFSRDADSVKLIKSLTKKVPELFTDVAFTLPYQKAFLPQNGKIKVGINVSGYIWNNGYSFAKLSLSVDYPVYCKTIINHLIQDEIYEIYLIPHVGLKGDYFSESDYVIAAKLHEMYPKTILIDTYKTPMDLKSYISAMDVFIGARMHATIAAFSSGVATIPFSYSKKFEGLFGSLEYDRIIHARTCSTEEAVSDTLSMIENYTTLIDEVDRCTAKSNALISKFRKRLSEIISECSNHKLTQM